MRILFDAYISGEPVRLAATCNDVFNLDPAKILLDVITRDDILIPLHKYVDDPDDFDPMMEIAVEELAIVTK